MKKFILLVSSFIAVSFISLLLFVQLWLNAAPPASVNQAEDALATNKLIFLAHINNERVDNLVNSFGSDPQSLDLPIIKNDLFSSLYFGAEELNSKLEQVIYGIQGDKEVSHHLMMQGQFDWQLIRPAIEQHFNLESLSNHTYQLTKRIKSDDSFTCPDERTKTATQIFYLFANKDWMLLSNKLQPLSLVTERLLSKQTADIDLSQWRSYRDQHLASMAILLPQKTPLIADRFTRRLVQKASQSNPEISSVLVGIELNLLEVGLQLNSRIHASGDWVTKALKTVQQQLDTMRAESSKFSPTLSKLMNNFNINSDQYALNSSLSFKEQDIEKFTDIFTEVLSSAFSSASQSPVSIEKESIEKSPWDYKVNDKFLTLADFKATDIFGTPSLVDGPLAISLTQASIDKEKDLLELSITGAINTPKIDGWWLNSKAKLSLQVNSVVDINKQEMLREERCLKDLGFAGKNQEVATGFQTNQQIASVLKRLRLKSASHFKDIANINGTLKFSIPTKVELIAINLSKGAKFEQYGVRFYLNDFSQQSISYQLSGDKEKVLEVRALNNKGQVLSFSYSSGMGNRKTANYRGDIASIQLVIAKQKTEYESQFNLSADQFFPEQKIKDYYLSKRPAKVSKTQWLTKSIKQLPAQKVMDYVSKGYSGENEVARWYSSPIGLLITHDNKSEWSTFLRYQLAIPLIDDLAYNLQAVEINTAHQQKLTTNYFPISPHHVINKDQSKGKYSAAIKIANIGYLKNTSDIKLGLKPQQQLSEVTGKLKVNLPKKLTTINVGTPDFTERSFNHGVNIKLVEINNSFIPRYQYQISAPNLINMIAILEDGRELLPFQAEFEQGKWQLKFPLSQKIARFEVLIAEEVEQLSYPFTLAPTYK